MTYKEILEYGIKNGYSNWLFKLAVNKYLKEYGIHNIGYIAQELRVLLNKWENVNVTDALEIVKDLPITEYSKKYIIKNSFPPNIKDTEKIISKVKEKSTKLPNKFLKLKEDVEKNPLRFIYTEFVNEKQDLDWVETQIKKLYDKYGYYNKIYDGAFPSGDNLGSLIFTLGMTIGRWGPEYKNDFNKLIPLLIKYDKDGTYTRKAINFWKDGIAELTQSLNKKVQDKSTKLPNKFLKLKEWTKLTESKFAAFSYIDQYIDFALAGKVPWHNVYTVTMGNMYYLTTEEALKIYDRLKKLDATGSLVNIDSKKMLSELLAHAKPIEASENKIKETKKAAVKLPNKPFKL